ncbi:unnamed protein product [Rhizophagus irregularis]|nr:unnamed protein product [Rhizophagus irregularis]
MSPEISEDEEDEEWFCRWGDHSYKHVSVTPSNEPKIFRLAPKCPTSSNFLQWAIKSTSQNTLNNSMFMSEISGESIGSIAV